MRARRTGRQLPLVAVEDLQVAVVPFDGRVGPDHLQAAGGGVLADTGTVAVLPAQALLLHRGGFRFPLDEIGIPDAVGLAEGVPADDQGRGLDVVHRHPGEGLPDVDCGRHRIGLPVGPLRVDVDQPHLHRGQGIDQITLAGVALVAQPGVLGTPVDLLGLPLVLAAEGETEGLQAHVIERDVAGEHQQVRPGQLLAVLLLDRPQQPARLVQVGVIRPTVQRREALHTVSGPAASVCDPVRACRMPGHPEEERAVVTEVGGPPLLGGLHHLDEVGPDRIDIQGLNRRPVVEAVVHRIDDIRIMLQHFEVRLIRPPVAVPPALDGRLEDRALLSLLLMEPSQQSGAQLRLGHGQDVAFVGDREFFRHGRSFRWWMVMGR